MTEATTEEAQEAPADAEADAPTERRTLERAIEAEESTEPKQTSRNNYQSRDGEGRYTKRAEYRNFKKNPRKISSGKPDLEQKAGSGITTYRSSMHAEIGHAEQMEKAPEESYDTHGDGVTYVLFHQDPITGEVSFSTETKTQQYRRDPSARNKKALHGETARVGEFDMMDVAGRGLKEENPDVYPILLKALKENGHIYDRVKTYFNGVVSETTLIEVEVKDPLEWSKYSAAKNAEGPKTIMSLSDIIHNTSPHDWAFNHYDILMGFVGKNMNRFHVEVKSPSSGSHFIPMTYTKPIGQYRFN